MHQSPPGPGPRVLHVAQPVDGGVARVVADLVRAQVAAGLRVAVACPGGELATAVRELPGVEVCDWRAGRSPGPGLPGEVRRLARLIEEVRPELVHAHSAKAGLAARLALRGRVPTVFQPHAWSFEAVTGPTAAVALRWERWGARWADRVLCVSEAERGTGERAGIRAAYRVVPNGIDTARFTPAGPGGGGSPHVVCVGRLCRQKGQDVLLRAWDTVRAAHPGARLTLVGDGPAHEVLRRSAHPSVHFAGAVTDVLPWYRAADLVVLPSRWEGMALVPLEAQACGRPVVLTDVDGARESLPPAPAAPASTGPAPAGPIPPGPIPAGPIPPAPATLAPAAPAPAPAAPCLVPSEDPAALAAAVTALLADPALRASLGDQGRRHVLSTHDVRHTAERIAALYREVLGARPPVSIERRESIHS
ncbi:glycosyltransferase [Streptomyces sp. LP11]|uniref:Glycosyltransferase n=1 Tax=Streptomyces pyxinicus TaxID=2970331 RepID=A0ABT2B8Y8_9ACTN|nr:glycosyltransferase [Streptomyces sp. LP11]MCS0604979.1 glycosyltransferase [Streptomyces sp. LP11]